MTDLNSPSWALYAGSRNRFIDLARSLPPGDADRTIPLTPEWTVAQALAHVCGLNGDLASGLREGLGTDERTKAQVSSRAGMSVEDVCGEWLGYEDIVRAIIEQNGFLGRRLAADLVIHFHDVQHAIGQPIDTADEATADAGQTYATHTVERWAEGGNPATIELSDGSRFAPEGADPSLTLRATPYDFLRSVSGRRSRAQVEGLGWSAEPGLLIDHFSPYGRLRDVDAEI